METDAKRMCALLVGLPDVVVVGVGDWPLWLRVVVAVDADRPTCGPASAVGGQTGCRFRGCELG